MAPRRFRRALSARPEAPSCSPRGDRDLTERARPEDAETLMSPIQYVREMRGHDQADERMCMRPRLRGLEEECTSAQAHLARIGNYMHDSSRPGGQRQPRVDAKDMIRKGWLGRGRGASLSPKWLL